MTPPALFVLSMALACTVVGTTHKTADHDKHTIKQEPIANMDWTNTNYIANSELNRLNNSHVEARMYDKYKRVKREEPDSRCEDFQYNPRTKNYITHPRDKDGKYYSRNTDCVTVIHANEGYIVKLTFVDVFRIEAHPDCAHDYIEIRDGEEGYAELLHKVCGEKFPVEISSTSPHLWLKFHSDDTIEYEGFHINVEFVQSPNSHSIPASCTNEIEGRYGTIDSDTIESSCTQSLNENNRPLDVLWKILSPDNTKIDLNFSTYSLAKPNECKENMVQVFGSVLEDEAKLAQYCGSVANSVSTKDSQSGNIMHVRLYTTKAGKGSKFSANFTAFRTLEPGNDECNDDEFNCEDNTCIFAGLKCNDYANCKLKADEEGCHDETKSQITEPHILVILVIFSLILSGMSFIFLFKCIRKLYQDHKIIKEHIRQSCEDRLDMVGDRLTLDAKRLQRDSEPRASLERENHTNEMYKQQRHLSQHKDMNNGGDINVPFFQQTSIDSDFIPEAELIIDDEIGRRDVDSHPIETEEIRVERNGRTRRSDMNKREESMRSRKREADRSRERKEIRDVSVGAPDTRESGCQTRESLFQTDQALSSDGSGSNSRGFSTFGYSGATIARPSPPAPTTNTTELTIELLKQVPRQDSKTNKKSDRRPMSTETTRSAPDVIIVSKPIR